MATLRVDTTALGGASTANTATPPQRRSTPTRPIVRPTTAPRLRQARIQALRRDQQQLGNPQTRVYAPSIVTASVARGPPQRHTLLTVSTPPPPPPVGVQHRVENIADSALSAKPIVRNGTAGKALVPGIKKKTDSRAAVSTRTTGGAGKTRTKTDPEYFLQNGDTYLTGKVVSAPHYTQHHRNIGFVLPLRHTDLLCTRLLMLLVGLCRPVAFSECSNESESASIKLIL